jgi:hypothetical protein
LPFDRFACQRLTTSGGLATWSSAPYPFRRPVTADKKAESRLILLAPNFALTLAIWRHCQLHAIDDRINEYRAGMNQGYGKLTVDLSWILDAHTLDANGWGHGCEVRIDKCASGVEEPGRLLLELDEGSDRRLL